MKNNNLLIKYLFQGEWVFKSVYLVITLVFLLGCERSPTIDEQLKKFGEYTIFWDGEEVLGSSSVAKMYRDASCQSSVNYHVAVDFERDGINYSMHVSSDHLLGRAPNYYSETYYYGTLQAYDSKQERTCEFVLADHKYELSKNHYFYLSRYKGYDRGSKRDKASKYVKKHQVSYDNYQKTDVLVDLDIKRFENNVILKGFPNRIELVKTKLLNKRRFQQRMLDSVSERDSI